MFKFFFISNGSNLDKVLCSQNSQKELKEYIHIFSNFPDFELFVPENTRSILSDFWDDKLPISKETYYLFRSWC